MSITIPVDEDIVLHTYEEQDTETIYALVEQNRAYLREWLPWVDAVTEVERQRVFIRHSLEQLAADDGFQCGIWYQGQMVGGIGFHHIDRHDRKTEIGYWLAKTIQGKGIMTRSCRAMVNYAFDIYGLHRVEIQVASENTRSRAIPERLGFSREGIKREDGWLYDHFVDHVIYSVLAREWTW